MPSTNKNILLSWVTFILLTLSMQVFAVPQLMVSPTRILFDKRDRSAQVQVINRGDEKGIFRISLVNKFVTDDGKYITAKEGESGNFANKIIRFSPRQVNLAPGESQTVRLLLRKPSSLAEGEYRSHMLFTGTPNSATNSIKNLVKTNNDKISIQIIPILGISIPVIVRHGSGNSSANISDVRFIAKTEKQKPKLQFKLHRKGEFSVYGDLKATLITKTGSEFIVANYGGVSVYPPNLFRNMNLILNIPNNIDQNNASIYVSYKSKGGNRGKLLTEYKNLLVP